MISFFSDKVNTYFSFHQIFKSFLLKKSHTWHAMREIPRRGIIAIAIDDTLQTSLLSPSTCLQLFHPWLVHGCLISLFTAEASFAWLPWQDRRGLQHYSHIRAKHRLRVVRRISLQNQRRVAIVRHYQSREITQRWHKDKLKSRISDWQPNLSETWVFIDWLSD